LCNDMSVDELALLREPLIRMGLIGASEQPPLTLLAGGVSSLIARVDTARGPLCVKRALPKLKVAAEWHAPVERNLAEVGWLKIAGNVVPGAAPAVLGEDREAPAFAMAYLDPSVYPVWKEQLRDNVIESATAVAVGERLAAIHGATAGDDAIARRFANDAAFHALRFEPYFAASARAHPDAAAALTRLLEQTAETKIALVHGDVSPKNILVGRHGPVFLDAECAWYGDPAFDLAFCLNHLLLKCLWRPKAVRQLLECFDVLTETYLERVSWEPTDEFERRAAALLPGLLLARVDGKSPVEYLTAEGDRKHARGFAKRLLTEPCTRLSAIRGLWQQEIAP
jgi:aminoglycoside phosphotransferase (APT) family kinase protein